MDSLNASERALSVHRLLNGTTEEYPRDAGVKELFESCAERFPDAVAVVHRDRTLTYRRLNMLANGLAEDLRRRGVAPGDYVGVNLARSPELVVALLAVLKCGAAYLPFDASWPDRRLAEVFAAADCDRLLSDRADALARRFPQRSVIPVGPAGPAPRAENPAVRVGPTDIAYVNFTSGSTGKPKGVPVQHRGITRLVFNARYARLDRNTTLLQLAPIPFDAATFEIWGALLHGGTCVLYPSSFVRLSELGRVLRSHRVTVLFLTTMLFNTVVDEAPEVLDGLETVLTGGEAHSLRHVAKALELYGPDRLTSVYGPTECTTFATYHPVRALRPDATALPIGRPIQNTRAYLVGPDGLCEPGETGELLLGGPGLSPGYLGAPELTRRHFVEYRIDGRPERLYRTGDRAQLLEDGDLVFQGRLDDQVKVNGHRIELGEVSYHLDRVEGVRQGYVTVTEGPAGEKALVAFVVAEDADRTPEQVRAALTARLPRYMVPSVIRLLSSLPLTATGKVDRRALLADGLPEGGPRA